MSSHTPKVYTMEDNVKYISFGIKDLVKEIETLNTTLSQLLIVLSQKKDDEKELPF